MRSHPPQSARLRRPGAPRENTAGNAPRRAFTLVEIVIVIAILGLLMAVLLPQVGDIFESSKLDAEEMKVNNVLKTPLLNYNRHMRHYPTTEEGLGALTTAPSNNADRWKGPYVDNPDALKDSWGRDYRYACPGTHNPKSYDLWSVGPDGQDGTADDIGNWRKTPAAK